MTDYLDRLAAFVEAVDAERLTDAAARAARLVLLDTIGAMVAGSALPENRRLAAAMHERRSRATATLLGHTGKADPLLATFVNATAGVALEVDEGSRLGGGHPAIHVIPGGTAVAVAKLAGLDAAGVRSVINLSASMSPANTWTTALEGATIRNAYPGRSGLEGILAVDLHRAGFTGLADAPSDVYGTILADRFEPERALDGLGGPLRIEQNYFKLYACCRYNHFALDALLAMAKAEGLEAAQVERVIVTTIPFGPRMADPAPTSMLGAKFSIPYAVAATLVLGRADVSAFVEPALSDPRIRALAARVEVRVDPQMSPRRADYPTAVVEVRLQDGRTLTDATTVVRGDFADPVPGEEIVAKFIALVSDVLGADRARAVVEIVDQVETLKDVRDLTVLLGQ